MKFKKFASLALSTVMAASMLAGCGSGAAESTGTTSNQTETKTETATTTETAGGDTAAASEVSHDSEYTVDFYDVAANFQGVQSGWYGKIVKDKFNMNLNIIAPQVSGDGAALYQTRCAAGALGDLMESRARRPSWEPRSSKQPLGVSGHPASLKDLVCRVLWTLGLRAAPPPGRTSWRTF